jgi:CRISPR/Cas system CMR-associated protein Cmr5 small subunit
MVMLATRSQRMSEAAFVAVRNAKQQEGWAEFRSFALKFPALIHTSGLCQAVALAQTDERGRRVLGCVIATLAALGGASFTDAAALGTAIRNAPALEYMRLTRLLMEAATLVKRYTEVCDA